MDTTFVYLTDGCEECEALLVVDLLRRGGVDVKTVAVTDVEGGLHYRKENERLVLGSHAIPILCDITIDEVVLEQADLLVVPGGKKGTELLKTSPHLREQLSSQAQAGKYVAAICAGPTVLGAFGLLEGKRATVFPGFEEGLEGAKYADKAVVRDGKLVTSRALGSAIPFALELLSQLKGEEAAKTVGQSIVYNEGNKEIWF